MLESLSKDSFDKTSLLNHKGSSQRDQLLQIIASSEGTMNELQGLIDKHSRLEGAPDRMKRVWHSYRIGRADLDSLRSRLTFHTSTIDVFLTSLQGSALSRIEAKLDHLLPKLLAEDEMSGRQTAMSTCSTTSSISSFATNEREVWGRLRKELMMCGVSTAQIASHQEEIIQHVKQLNQRHSPGRNNSPAAGVHSLLLSREISATSCTTDIHSHNSRLSASEAIPRSLDTVKEDQITAYHNGKHINEPAFKIVPALIERPQNMYIKPNLDPKFC